MSWGGVELRLQPPTSAEPAPAPADTATTDEEAPPPLEFGPLLYTVERSGDATRLTPVAILSRGGTLRSLPSANRVEDLTTRLQEERMSPADRFVLFAGGDRVGSFYPDGAGAVVDSTYCAPRPTVTGHLEVLPGATDVQRFLALPPGLGERYRHGGYQRVSSSRDQRVASLNMAAALFSTLEIRWPPSILGARADVQVFRTGERPEELVAATFLYGDSLAVGDAPDNAYSLFFLGERADDDGYDPTYVRYREVGVHGKGATRFVDHLDWTGDGSDEVLLEAYGSTSRWFSALTRSSGEWREAFREECAEIEPGAGVARRPGEGSEPSGRSDDPGR